MRTQYESTESLILFAQAGDREAMEILVTENDALVRFVVKKFIGRGKEYEDLYQLGRIGLVKAVENFDAHFEVKFSTYAVPVIMGEIRRFLRDDHPIHISRTIRENAKKAVDFLNEYHLKHSKSPSVDEICKETNLKREDVILALDSSKPVKSLTEPVSGDSKRMIQDTVGMNPYEEVEKNLLVESLLKSLDEKERTLLELRYFKRLTQTRVAEILGLTQVQVSRLEKKLLLRLRKNVV
ncbi:MAG: sigma-70 family RNA polymerase sigma factor [Clostridia bacterium]|nr:sigma-70 family RNA polymerase sigma factor [Clostridia bacterium]